MINEIMTQVRNHFAKTIETGTFSIAADGKLSGLNNTYLVGQYLWVYGSVLNDDVYKILSIENGVIALDGTGHTAEVGDFTVFGLAVPKDFLRLVDEIKAYKGADGVASESIGKYSVSYKNGGGWSEVFRVKLNKYRRLYDDNVRGVVDYNWQNRM